MKKSAVVLLNTMYWVIYGSFWIGLQVLGYLMSTQTNLPHHGVPIMKTVVTDITLCILSVVPFYSFYTVLFTKFLNKQKIGLLCTYGALASILCGLLFWVVFRVEDISTAQSTSVTVLQLIAFSALSLLNGIVALILKVFISFYGDIKVKEDLSRKNHEMELALVKNQINPHFLFNTLNNIDVLITKDAIQASVYLKKLSDIMRFMLYVETIISLEVLLGQYN